MGVYQPAQQSFALAINLHYLTILGQHIAGAIKLIDLAIAKL